MAAPKMRIKPWWRAFFLERYTRIKKRKTKKGNKAVVALQRVVIPIKRPEAKASIMLRLWSSITKQRMLKDKRKVFRTSDMILVLKTIKGGQSPIKKKDRKTNFPLKIIRAIR